jgi:hypothetical protein
MVGNETGLLTETFVLPPPVVPQAVVNDISLP